jgi:Flp pilus assembly protein TadD
MKNNKLSLLGAFMAAAVLSSCGGLNKMKDNAKLVTYSMTPAPLEVKGGQVQYSINGKFPAKYFNKKAQMTLSPYVKYNGGEYALKSLALQGEGVQANEKVIKYNEGGDFAIADKFAYKPEMQLSEVEVRLKLQMGKNVLDLPAVKVGDGIIATEYLVVKDPRAISVGDKFVRESSSSVQADIKYLINKADVRSSELKKEELKKMNEMLKVYDADPKKQIKGIELSAYASPDGDYDLNDKLAGKRKETANDYFKKELKKAKLTKVSDNIFTYLTTAEDWDGFKSLVEKSDIKDKELILRVLSMYSDPVVREKEIKNIAAAYDDLKEKILPELRRSKFTVTVVDSGKSDEELVAAAQSTPDSLQLEELMYAAKLTTDLDKQLAIYKAAANKYPADFRPKNNAGYVLVKQGKIAEAKEFFLAAQKVEDNIVVKNNLGLVAFTEGDMNGAEELYKAAMGAGNEVNYNLGIIQIIKGQYADAINSFGNASEANAALARILAKENNEALNTLNSIQSEDAIVYYLRAIVGARTQNTDMIFNNLRSACGKSAELKANAAKDLEFAKYFADENFKSIVK